MYFMDSIHSSIKINSGFWEGMNNKWEKYLFRNYKNNFKLN